MKTYTTDKIRNVVLLGHGGAGKTSLVEAMAYLSGITSRLGNVADGSTVSDFGKEEQKRGISLSTSVVPIEWGEYKINILDTPGYMDFVGEVEEAVSAADGAIIVVNGKAGVEAGTKRAWDLCEKYKLPRLVFVTAMDVDNASFRQVVEDMSALYGKKMAPFNFYYITFDLIMQYPNRNLPKTFFGIYVSEEPCGIFRGEYAHLASLSGDRFAFLMAIFSVILLYSFSEIVPCSNR